MSLLSKNEIHSLINFMRVAADKFEENVELFEEIAEKGGNRLVTAQAAKQLAEQFRYQREAAILLSDRFANAESVELIDEEDE